MTYMCMSCDEEGRSCDNHDFNHALKDKARQHNTTERQSNTTQLPQAVI